MPQDSLEIFNNEAMEPYSYQPLAQGCIRLIRLLPGKDEDIIQCEISPYTLKSGRISGPFDALSYVWGDTQQPGTVYVHNIQQNTTHSLLVTKNLHVALTQLRDPEISMTMWIDAICINQKDLEERASQVRMMAQIYSHAARVVVWLGQTAEDSEAVFNVLLLLAQRSSRPQSDENLDLSRIANLKIHPLKALLHRAWFNRVWVLQEVAAARCVSITCGPSELMSYDFLRGLRAWFEISKINDYSLLDLQHSIFHLMDKEVASGVTPFTHYISGNDAESIVNEESGLQAREIGRAGKTVIRLEPRSSLQIAPLAELLQRFQAHAATDRRDKVYALLGMCTDKTNHPSLQVDYTKAWPTLSSEIAAGPTRSLGRRYLTRVIFQQADDSDLNPEQLLELLSATPQLLEAARLCWASLAEVRRIALETTSLSSSRKSPAPQPIDWRMVSSLLEETLDVSAILNLFEEARRYSLRGAGEYLEIYSQILIPRAADIYKCILMTELCDALVEQWESLPVGQVSVLEFLCDMYTSHYNLVFVYLDRHMDVSGNPLQTEGARRILARGCLVASMRAIAPWIDTAPNSYGSYYDDLQASLDMLWASKPSQQKYDRLAIDT